MALDQALISRLFLLLAVSFLFLKATHSLTLQVFLVTPFHAGRISRLWGRCSLYVSQKKPYIFSEALGSMELSMVWQI